jgi:UDPglucose 6-dehydrogenase
VAEEQARRMVVGIEFADSPLQAVEGVDAAVLVTEWKELVELDWREVSKAMSGDLLIDGRNALEPEAVRAAGLTYEGIGRR